MAVQFVIPEVIPYGMAPAGEAGALQLVELCGRTAYKSEDKITENSAKSFVVMLKKLGHLSVLEHSNVVLKVSLNGRDNQPGTSLQLFGADLLATLKQRNAYHRLHYGNEVAPQSFSIAGNFRAWIETLDYLGERKPVYQQFFSHHLTRYYPSLFGAAELSHEHAQFVVTLLDAQEQLDILREASASDLPVFVFKFICDRGITHEVVRHRVLSFTQESTRYVNYQNKGMVVMVPEELSPFFDAEKGMLSGENPLVVEWATRANTLFEWYQADLERGLKPEIARDILPNLLKSEIFVSGRWSGWEHFIGLRDSPKAHPRIRVIAKEVRKYFDSIGLRIR